MSTAHLPEPPYTFCGRCRSGRRWFWYAVTPFVAEHCTCAEISGAHFGPHEHGWADTEDAAIEAMSDAVVQLGGDLQRRVVQAGYATDALKRVNAAKRAAKPPKGDTSAGVVEYLYGAIDRHHYDGYAYDAKVIPFQIIRRTAKRIYYRRDHRPDGSHRSNTELQIGFIDRARFETPEGHRYWPTAAGEIHHRRCYEDDAHLFATREAAEDYLNSSEREVPDLKTLKTAMAAAHPDRGGTDAEFIAARKAYERALRGAVAV